MSKQKIHQITESKASALDVVCFQTVNKLSSDMNCVLSKYSSNPQISCVFSAHRTFSYLTIAFENQTCSQVPIDLLDSLQKQKIKHLRATNVTSTLDLKIVAIKLWSFTWWSWRMNTYERIMKRQHDSNIWRRRFTPNICTFEKKLNFYVNLVSTNKAARRLTYISRTYRFRYFNFSKC